jgi:hypothetical protein
VNASIDKAIAPLLAAAATALLGLATGQAVDFSGLYTAVISTVAGLAAAGVTFYAKYHARRPNKAFAAAALPLAIALVHYLSTRELNEPEFLLALQGVVSFIGTYYSERIEAPGEPAPVQQAAVRRRR